MHFLTSSLWGMVGVCPSTLFFCFAFPATETKSEKKIGKWQPEKYYVKERSESEME